jgi:release factor glutamine methyltransferase
MNAVPATTPTADEAPHGDGALSVAAALRRGALALAAASESPRRDAEILLGSVLGRSRAGLISADDAPVDAPQRREFGHLLARRRAGAPVAYLTGTREFWSLEFAVSPAVLVPRPETELLVALALEHLPAKRECAVLDLGTGSGAIAIAIAHERPRAVVTGIDRSAAALAVARANGARLVADRVRWRAGSWFEPVPDERFDVIVANPPYIAADDAALARLAAEPLEALTPGATGLESFATIIAAAPAHLRENGVLALEHGATQAEAVTALFSGARFAAIQTRADDAGLPRVTYARFLSSNEAAS